MIKELSRSDYGVRIHRKQTIHTAVTVLIGLLLISSLVVVFIGWMARRGDERQELLRLWENGSYAEVQRISGEELTAKPMDYFLLTLHGFASYELAIAQINTFDTLKYINDSISSLRKALLSKEGSADARLHYVLGKAYYYKGPSYADLAIRYLEMAREGSWLAQDIPEYLGLAYASIHDYRNSVSAFSLALDSGPGEEDATAGDVRTSHPSDLLLLSIARSYMALGEQDSAMAYLVRCLENSRDSDIRVATRLLMGGILEKSGDTTAAETQYLTILEENGENANAHYQLGELYAAGGDPTRARAEWRKAVRIDPAHKLSRTRLNM
ncbi:MAG: tetratricopeptide repeat protein [Spirochaetaceae bacterium]|jgi:tetratricopeptide (TPR) repeat protein|nr:tetratricopeptide repeat protein [Spirochaetaceae bacterium]